MHWHKYLHPDTPQPYKTYELCYKAEYVKTLQFWGKIVKFCAQIVRNWELFLVYIFVDALAQMFATWYLATSQNILVMPQS